jgi:hypothetical protein
LEHTVKNCHGINNITTKIQFQASSKKLFNLQKLWLLLENGCLTEEAAVMQDSNTSYAVVYSVDNNVPSHFNTNFTYSLSKFGNTVLSNLRILPDCEVTWVQLNQRRGQSEELQVNHRNLQVPIKLLINKYTRLFKEIPTVSCKYSTVQIKSQ